MKQRLTYLDNIKVMLTLLVIFHHAGQAYGQGGGWPYTPSNNDEFLPWIWHFFAVNASFFMGLYFFISGYFIPRSFDHQGFATFVKKKLLRLGVPLVAMGSVISFCTGKFELAHMWFVENLLFFCILYALFRLAAKPIDNQCNSRPTIIGLTAAALIMGFGSWLIREASPQDHWISLWVLVLEPAHYLQYVMMFVLGILAYRFDWLDKMNNKTGATALAIGLLLALDHYLRGTFPWDELVWQWFGFYESLMCVFISFGLLWIFRQYANKENAVMQWLAQQSYGAYVFHLPLMLGIQYLCDGLWMGAFAKFLFIGVATAIVSFLNAWLIRLIPGAKQVI